MRSISQDLRWVCVQCDGMNVALEGDESTHDSGWIAVRQKKVRHDDDPNVEGSKLCCQTLSFVECRCEITRSARPRRTEPGAKSQPAAPVEPLGRHIERGRLIEVDDRHELVAAVTRLADVVYGSLGLRISLCERVMPGLSGDTCRVVDDDYGQRWTVGA